MTGNARWRQRLMTGVVALLLAIAPAATCVAGTIAAAAAADERCPLGGHENGKRAVELDCCSGQAPAAAGLTSATFQASDLAPLSGTALANMRPAERRAPLHSTGALEPGIPKPSRTPTYLLVSTFRL